MKRLGSFRIKLIFTSGKVCLVISSVLALGHSLLIFHTIVFHLFYKAALQFPLSFIHVPKLCFSFPSGIFVKVCRGLLSWTLTWRRWDRSEVSAFFQLVPLNVIFTKGFFFDVFSETVTACKGVLYKLHGLPNLPVTHKENAPMI